MEFTSPVGPSVIVPPEASGQRLQAFVARAFREQLGRSASSIHSASRLAAAAAIRERLVSVGSETGLGRRVVRAGEVVSLRGVPSSREVPHAQEQRARMALSVHQEAGEDGGELGEAGDERVGGEGAEGGERGQRGRGGEGEEGKEVDKPGGEPAPAIRAFRSYYEEQRLWEQGEWAAIERAFSRPLPLCLRAPFSVPSHGVAAERLSSLLPLSPLPWAAGAFCLRAPDGMGSGGEEEQSRAMELLREAVASGEIVLQAGWQDLSTPEHCKP